MGGTIPQPSPSGQRASWGPLGAPRVGLALRLLRRSVVPGRGPSLGVRFLTSRAGVSPVWALVAAQGHGGLTTCGTGPGPWDSVPVSVTGTVSVRRFPVCPGHPPSRGSRPFFGQREEGEAPRDSCVVTPRRASSPGDPASPFTQPRDFIHAGGAPAQRRALRPLCALASSRPTCPL